jgi:geranylgeranyl diphosphate synthase type II
MDNAELMACLAEERRLVEKELRALMRSQRGIPTRLLQAMNHSLLGGGKRLRPIIVVWTWRAVAAGRKRGVLPLENVLRAACALEMIHTYSLIHDDLPAMDDDVLRRGLPTCHVAFDEPTAILAGDGLQALAFQVLAASGGAKAGPLVELVARAVGPAGMVGGQQDDLDSEGVEPDARLVRRIHLKKTAALLGASFGTGALLAGSSAVQVQQLVDAGLQLGLAFQGADDLLDVTATREQLGKSPGKDLTAGKATWVRLEGLEKAGRRTRKHGRKGLASLLEVLPAGKDSEKLTALGELMWNRDR